MKIVRLLDRNEQRQFGARLAVGLGLLVLGPVQADGQGICNRTPQVRDAILATLRQTDCRRVTSSSLRAVEILHLHRSSLRRLRSDDFRGLSGLTGLYLDKNDLSTLPQDVFSGLANLQALSLSENRLVSLPPGLFRGLTSLVVLRLESNALTSLPPGLFLGLSRLRDLHLNDNNLTALSPGLFSGLSRLRDLYLNDNNLTVLSPELFSGLTALYRLNVSENDITELPRSLFAGLSNLEQLQIAGNRVESYPSGLFAGLSKLRALYGGRNKVTQLPGDLFRGLRSLEYVNLSGNELAQLPEGIFSELSLVVLGLGDNELAHLPAGIFKGLHGLQALSLAENRLASLPEGVFDDLRRLWTLRLEGNPGSPFSMPLRFERTVEGTDGAMGLQVWRIAKARYALEVALKATGGVVSSPDGEIEYEGTHTEVVTWRPTESTASVTAVPRAVTRVESRRFGWFSTEATIRLADLPPATLGSCAGLEDDLTAVCFRDGRFLFRVDWRSQYDGSEGVGTMRQLTDESAVATFFDEENVELVFKLLDGRGLNEHFWVFYGALSDVEYTLSVTDRETGEFREYRNPPGEICGRGDTMAFPAGSGAASLSGSGLPDRVGASQSADCPAGALCLQDGRFQVTATWSNPATGETGVGTPIPDTDSAGYMWFFSPGNIELVLKVLDGRWFNDSWWVYASALTDVDYAITVLDTSTGASRTYANNPARPFCGFGDIGAFPE